MEPSEKTDTVKELYSMACRFFIETFGAALNPKIRLNNVRYIDDWSVVSAVSGESEEENERTHGIFVGWGEITTNDIYVNTNNIGKNFIEGEIAENSVLFHELIHFFVKSANFEHFLENEITRDVPMEEALSYWSQNKYVETVTGGLDLMDYILPEDEDISITEHFPYISFFMFNSPGWRRFVHNSIHFFNDDPKEEYNRAVVRGLYSIVSNSYMGGFKRPRRRNGKPKKQTP